MVASSSRAPREPSTAFTVLAQRFGDDDFGIVALLVEAKPRCSNTGVSPFWAAQLRRCPYYEPRSSFIQSLPEHFLRAARKIPVPGKCAAYTTPHFGPVFFLVLLHGSRTIWTGVSLPQVLAAPLGWLFVSSRGRTSSRVISRHLGMNVRPGGNSSLVVT